MKSDTTKSFVSFIIQFPCLVFTTIYLSFLDKINDSYNSNPHKANMSYGMDILDTFRSFVFGIYLTMIYRGGTFIWWAFQIMILELIIIFRMIPNKINIYIYHKTNPISPKQDDTIPIKINLSILSIWELQYSSFLK